MASYLLGIDLGTTNIKGIIADEEGRVLASAARPCKTYTATPGASEQNADEWWSQCVSILQEMTGQAGREVTSEIKGISISSHVISMLPVDADGIPLRNAMIYQDSRSAAEVEEILDAVGFDRFISIIGSRPSVAFLPNKIRWFRKNEPELFARTRCILQANGYLNYKLTGVLNQDADCASRTQCYDRQTLKISDEIAAAAGADLEALLPAPSVCTEIIGTVTKAAAEQTGLAEGTPVIAGASDAMAAMYSTGMSSVSEAGESSGTTSLVFVGAKDPSAPDVPIATRPCYLKGVPYLFDAPIGASGASIQWYLNTAGLHLREQAKREGLDVFGLLTKEAQAAPAGSRKVLYFPYLVAGERAPLWNSHARGMFIGLTIQSENSDLARSVLEGTSFALRHVITEIKKAGGAPTSLRVTGGGARNPLWNQIKASMLHMPVLTLDEKGGDVPFGDCLIAGVATGVFPDLSASVKDLIRVREQTDPVPEWERVYDELFPYYVEYYQKADETLKNYASVVIG